MNFDFVPIKCYSCDKALTGWIASWMTCDHEILCDACLGRKDAEEGLLDE